MTTALQTTEANAVAMPADVSISALEAALAGDLARLTQADRLRFYNKLCEFTGLNPLSQPFDWVTFQGKLKLYANKGCAEQLRKIHGISVAIVERHQENGVYWVRAKLTDKDGRSDESIGAVALPANASGEVLANAMMKAETKVKRRGTFSIAGLSMLVLRDKEEDQEQQPKPQVSAADTAAALNAEIVEVGAADEKGTLLAQIQAAISEKIPGTDFTSKQAKADLLAKSFGARSWIVVEAMPIEKLKDGLAKITTPPAEREPVAQPAPEEPPFEVQPNEVLDKETVAKLEALLADCKTSALRWLVKQGWIRDDQGLEHLAKSNADKILNRGPQFVRAVTQAR